MKGVTSNMRITGSFIKNTNIINPKLFNTISRNWKQVVKLQGDFFSLDIWSDEENNEWCISENEQEFCVIFGTPIDRYGNRLINAADIFLAKKLDFPDSVQGPILGVFVDKKKGELLLFRDRFGSKTLYWENLNNHITFSSEIKFILTNHSNINKETLYNFMSLNYRMVYGRGETFFDGINEIPTACACYFDSNLKPNIYRYWNPPNLVSNLSENNLQEEFEKLFNRSMKRSLLEADNPIFYLSGGLDAPLVAAIAKELTGKRINTIGAIFPGFSNNNEEKFINDLVKDLSENHVQIDGSKLDYGELLSKSVSHHDQPLISATYLLFFHMMNIVSDSKFKSIFGGGGGDLVTQGCLEYQPYVLADYYYKYPNQFIVEMENWTKKVGPYLRYWPKSKEQMVSLIGSITSLSGGQLKAKHNPDWLTPTTSIFRSEMIEEYKNSRNELMEWDYSTFRQIRLADEFFSQAVPTHFVEEINVNSFNGISSYDPFWDLDLIEFGFKLPLEAIFRDGFTKPLTRNFGKNFLPKSILTRPDKTGLGIPIEVLVGDKNLNILVNDFLADNSALDYLGFDKLKVQLVIDGIRKNNSKVNEAYFWKICSIAAWYYAWV